MKGIDKDELKNARHKIGLYSIRELCVMFECGRARIDSAINSNHLSYISPNGRTRYIYIKDFLDYFNKK